VGNIRPRGGGVGGGGGGGKEWEGRVVGHELDLDVRVLALAGRGIDLPAAVHLLAALPAATLDGHGRSRRTTFGTAALLLPLFDSGCFFGFLGFGHGLSLLIRQTGEVLTPHDNHGIG
jgi:hypothetical protein